jgi:hypothetical protein
MSDGARCPAEGTKGNPVKFGSGPAAVTSKRKLKLVFANRIGNVPLSDRWEGVGGGEGARRPALHAVASGPRVWNPAAVNG